MIEAKIMGMRDEVYLKRESQMTLKEIKKQTFEDFKSLAVSFMMAERLEV